MISILKRQIDLRQTAHDTYTASWHSDWVLGSTLHGGCVAAIIHYTAATHLATEPALVRRNQPDILKLQIEFLRACERCESTVTVTILKLGATSSILQLQLSQNGQVKIHALATSTDFEKPLGPTVRTAWSLLPHPKPVPDFDRVKAHQPEPNWVPARLSGEIIPFTSRMLILDPRGGFPFDGICDAWNGFQENEYMDSTYLAMMADTLPSMSDTLLRNGGLYDAHAFYDKAEVWARENPGVPAEITNSISEALQASTFNQTISLDIVFKRRLPTKGIPWIFTRTATKMLDGGRMNVDVTICNQDMELLCESHQLVLVLEAQRKFRGSKEGSVL
ncbi:putative Thioesterase domain-containing protein [Seiridium unicorne]|uniref:Thioesterase domain-containing protein n=1 Tax=Seiridium unicorne TaxID=138068 RepID=A0ABR2UVQ4_9PEZI